MENILETLNLNSTAGTFALIVLGAVILFFIFRVISGAFQSQQGIQETSGLRGENVQNTSKEAVQSDFVAGYTGGGSFLMHVEDVFPISGRGTVATGIVEQGTIKVGDEVEISDQEGSFKAKVAGVEMSGRSSGHAQAGDNVGLLLANVNKSKIKRGQILTK